MELEDIITVCTLISFEEYVKESIRLYAYEEMTYNDMQVVKEFGYELLDNFTPKSSHELYLQITFEEMLDRIEMTLDYYS